MTDAAQRRAPSIVTVKITDEAVEITAETRRPMDIIREAERLFQATRPEKEPRITVGFGPQHAERTYDRPVPGRVWLDPVTAKEESHVGPGASGDHTHPGAPTGGNQRP